MQFNQIMIIMTVIILTNTLPIITMTLTTTQAIPTTTLQKIIMTQTMIIMAHSKNTPIIKLEMLIIIKQTTSQEV
jgi:hypothetical protein